MYKSKKVNNKEKGITLIALIITIIILLILAGVTINILIGDNGLLNTTKQATEKYEKAAIKEELESYILDIQISNYMNITMQDVIDELPIKCPGVEWIDIDGAEPIGEYKGYEFKVKSDYTVEILGMAKGAKPEITKVEIEENGTPLQSVNIKITAIATDGKTITSVVEEKSNTSLVQNADGTYSLNGITNNGVYIIKVTDSEGRTRRKNVEIDKFRITVTVNTDGNGTASGAGAYKEGEKINLQATANQDFKFKGWYVGNTEISKDNPYTYEVKKEITITAKFEFDGILISKITLNKSSVKVGKNATNGIQLEYTIEPSDATNKEVVWTVDKPDLLTVTNGRIVGKGTLGTAKVTCKALYGEASTECNVEIVDGTFIYTPEDFINNFASRATGGTDSTNYYIMNDIDMSGYEYKRKDVIFSGTLDGQGHTVKNLKISYDGSNCGLTSGANKATYCNILFKNVDITGKYKYVGVLAGDLYGPITCSRVGITGKLTGEDLIGPFVGYFGNYKSTLTNCYSRVNLVRTYWSSNGPSLFASGNYSATHCYVAARGTNEAGKNVLLYDGEGTHNSCYFDKNLFNGTGTTGFTGLSTTQFANSSNFTGWDFENTWFIDEETGYPELKFTK